MTGDWAPMFRFTCELQAELVKEGGGCDCCTWKRMELFQFNRDSICKCSSKLHLEIVAAVLPAFIKHMITFVHTKVHRNVTQQGEHKHFRSF